ncbi:hypothetical protein [Azospirillum picis]|uniref:ABC transporter permease n=1 Tax=Azospirillum picis TaxID=488438 RepID=A0ABU0MQ96_9PROT|nr:hypothetical protein [Azospirillum picis]MBP2302063.1 hypothetical protein [Azospirillum picis]MDQ0535646.1 hypothetical protein [Azospirillum picis]
MRNQQTLPNSFASPPSFHRPGFLVAVGASLLFWILLAAWIF